MTTEELFLRSIAAYLNNEPLSVNEPAEEFWHTLMNLAQEQKLLAPVFEVLHESMPEHIREHYRGTAVLQVARQTSHTAEFLQVYDRLVKDGFQPIVVKGIVARTTYGKPDFRISADEDVYLPRKDYPAFHRELCSLGFQSSDVPDMKNAHEERYLRHDFMIEGHWELFPQENEFLASLNRYTDGFWQRARTISVDRVTIQTLEPTDHMTFLLLHAFKHFISSGFGIRQICDIVQWSKAYDICWDTVHEILTSVRAQYFAAAVFGIGETYFSMNYPEHWERTDYTPLLHDSLSGGIYGSSTMSRKHSSTMTLGAVESGYIGKRFVPLVSSLFPNRAVMEMSYPWVRKSALFLPASWFLRITRYLHTRGSRNSSSEAIRIGSERTRMLKYYKIL